MLKLFIRFYLLMAILTVIIFVVGLNSFLEVPFVQDVLANGISQGEVLPIFTYINRQLMDIPQTEWSAALVKLAPSEPHTPISLEPLDQIKVNQAQYRRLLKGQIIGIAKFFHAPLNDTTDTYAGTVYQRIGQSDQVLVMPIKTNQDDNNEMFQQIWLIHFINLELSHVASDQKNAALQQFNQTYHIGLKWVALQQLTPEIQAYLKQHGYLHDQGNNIGGLINFYYLYTPDTVLIMGPYQYPWYLNQFLPIFVSLIMLVVAIFMFVSLYMFYRDLKKLDRLAEAYGEGNFAYPEKIKRYAALGSLYHNLKVMGQRIQALLNSHKDLTQAVSHELKTPLARLKFAITMARESDAKATALNYLQQADDSVNDLEKLVNELLMYTRFDREFVHETQRLCLAELLPDYLTEMQTRYPDKKLNWHIAPELQTTCINMAPHYLKKVLDNLLSNAHRYATSQIEVSVFADQTRVYLEVADDGMGVPEAYRQKIFEPFFSIDESRNKELSGHGLGLAIVERIIQAHHGDIQVMQSASLKGAAFILSFPIIIYGVKSHATQ